VYRRHRVINPGGGARLNRDPGDALHPGLEFDDVSRARKSRIGGGRVADLGIDGDVGPGVSARERCARLDRRRRMGHRRQGFIIHGDQFGAVFGCSEARRHDHRDDLSAVTDLFRRHWEMRRNERRGAVRVFERDVGRMPRPDRMRDRLKPVFEHAPPGQHRKNPGRRFRRRRIERTNAGVRMR